MKIHRNNQPLAAQLPPLPPGCHFRLVIGRTSFLVSLVNNETGIASGIVLQGRINHLPAAEITSFASTGANELIRG